MFAAFKFLETLSPKFANSVQEGPWIKSRCPYRRQGWPSTPCLKFYIFCISAYLRTIAQAQNNFTLLHSADLDTLGWELDHDEPPDGEGKRQEDGYSVDEVAEVHVELHKIAPALGELQTNIFVFVNYSWSDKSNKHSYLTTHHLLLVPGVGVQQVHVDTEGDVLQHVEAVCYGNAGEDHVDGVVPHVGVGQHHNVQQIEETAQEADIQGEVAVYWRVHILNKRTWHTKNEIISWKICFEEPHTRDNVLWRTWSYHVVIFRNYPVVVNLHLKTNTV